MSSDPVDLDTPASPGVSPPSGDDIPIRKYAPNATYAVGDRVRLDDEVGDVIAVRPSGSPRQGPFSVIDVQTPGGEVRRMVAEAPPDGEGAPEGRGAPEGGGASDWPHRLY